MIRHYDLLLVLSLLLALLAAPAVAQDEATSAPEAPTPMSEAAGSSESAESEPTERPTLPPLPTAMPVADSALVQAVLFFSPTCGHCHLVITETLPPLFAEHGGEPVVTFDQSIPPQEVAFYLMSNGQLQVLLVDVSIPDGQAMFQADSVRLETDSGGVPRLDVGDIYLVGSADIPAQFPDIVSDGLSGDGLAWPALPALDQALAPFVASGAVPDPAATPAPTAAGDGADPAATPVPSDPAEPSPAASADADGDSLAVIPLGDDGGPLDRFGEDPVGNGVSVVVLLLLGVSLVAAPLLAMRGSLPRFPGWLVSVLVLVGIVVAAYLATVETTGSEAVCGPVGDCNAVQQSEYAQLFGIHVGVLGVLGYLLIGILWVVSRVAKGVLADWSLVLIALGSLFGVAFSTYLTFLEPFVIGATCLWCITSALVMLGLLWVSAGPGWAAWQRIRNASDGGHHATAGA